MNEYKRGVCDTLIYVITGLENMPAEAFIEELRIIKQSLEKEASNDFKARFGHVKCSDQVLPN